MTSIAEGTIITGDISVEHDLRIEGTIQGSVLTGGTLVLCAGGKIEGDIRVKSATIAGLIVGNIKASEKIVLESKSTLKGDLVTRDLVINEGAHFQGNCSMSTDERK